MPKPKNVFLFRVSDTRRKPVWNHPDSREPLFFTVKTGTKSWMEIVVANFGSVGIALEKDMKLNMMGGGGGKYERKKKTRTHPTCNRVATHPRDSGDYQFIRILGNA
jgi:hypothetical protein